MGKPLTLRRLLVLIICVSFGSELGIGLGRRWGLIGLAIGFPLGTFLAVYCADFIVVGWYRLFIHFPHCRNGKCSQPSDYMWLAGTFYGCEGWRKFRYRCRCGDIYLRKGRHFMEVLPDGTLRLYKKQIGFGKWEDES
jgi:hypothetical protein